MPEVRNKTNSQSRSSSQGRTSSHICTQIPDPRFPVGLEDQAPMSRRAVAVIRPALFIISPSVPCHPVWHRASRPLLGTYQAYTLREADLNEAAGRRALRATGEL